MTTQKKREGCEKPSSQKTTELNEDNLSMLKKLLRFSPKVNNNNKNKKKTKTLSCNCWVCKILDSSTSVTKTLHDDDDETDTTTSATKRYEPYNFVSETGDSIFYDPFLSNIFNDNDDKLAGEIYVSETAIKEVVNRIIDQKRVGSSINNIKNGN